jgi:hypothetical protein
MEHINSLGVYFQHYGSCLNLKDETWMKIGKQNQPENWLGAYELECSRYVYRAMILDRYIA